MQEVARPTSAKGHIPGVCLCVWCRCVSACEISVLINVDWDCLVHRHTLCMVCCKQCWVHIQHWSISISTVGDTVGNAEPKPGPNDLLVHLQIFVLLANITNLKQVQRNNTPNLLSLFRVSWVCPNQGLRLWCGATSISLNYCKWKTTSLLVLWGGCKQFYQPELHMLSLESMTIVVCHCLSNLLMVSRQDQMLCLCQSLLQPFTALFRWLVDSLAQNWAMEPEWC